ncbi:hypothetical protein AALP_AA3G364400 [Arabis alpina]|uniref:NYN domain-containing protein n=1 Tax=Arabis alpina TaxID=50452 RepID=A0A087HE13_ARAAL|nr:hypothetical protein AALP_AA3G364400 [Arabis alpina]
MTGESNKAKTGVFWNIDHCPIPGGFSPGEIKEFIKVSLKKEGYLGDVSIWAYSDKTSVVDELEKDYYDHGSIILRKLVEGVSKVNSMIMDILLFCLDNAAPSNIYVISKDIEEDTVLFDILQSLESEDYCILVAQPSEEFLSEALLPIVSFHWCWPGESDLE